MIFVDRSLVGLLWPLLDTFETVRHIVVMDDGGGDVPEPRRRPGRSCTTTRTLLAARRPGRVGTSRTRTRPRRCATRAAPRATPRASSTRHRSTWLHTMARHDRRQPRRRARATSILPVVPMFHANAWGLAHAAVAVRGRRWCMPGPDLSPDGDRRPDRGRRRSPSPPACPPSGWACCPSSKGRDTSRLRAIPCGGSAVPRALSEAYREQTGLPIMQAWGMTETSPVASVGRIKSHARRPCTEDELADLRTTVGLPLARRRVPRRRPDDRSSRCRGTARPRASCRSRGPWIAREYYNDDRSPRVLHRRRLAEDRRRRHGRRRGLHPPRRPHQGRGEVRRRVDQLGRARERDHGPPRRWPRPPSSACRTRSGSERPLACVVVKPGEAAHQGGACSSTSTAGWPSGGCPTTSCSSTRCPRPRVGKFSKKDLRDRFADYELPTA